MTVMFFLGIDVSKARLDVALFNSAKYKHKKFPNTPAGYEALVSWLIKQQKISDLSTIHVCLESTGVYSEGVSEYLFDQGLVVSVVNPARVKGFAQGELSRTKTDKGDASLLARFCSAMTPESWEPLPPKQRRIRELVRRLEPLMTMQQQEKNRLEGAGKAITEQLNDHVEYLETQIKDTKQQIRDLIDDDPDLGSKNQLLQSIPGIGEATAAVILSEFSSLAQFRSAKALAAYIGVIPRIRESGSSVHGRGGMAKMGRRLLRKALYLPAVVALRYNPVMQAMKERLTLAGKSKMTIVGAAMRKLVHLIYGVIKSGQPFDPNYAR